METPKFYHYQSSNFFYIKYSKYLKIRAECVYSKSQLEESHIQTELLLDAKQTKHSSFFQTIFEFFQIHFFINFPALFHFHILHSKVKCFLVDQKNYCVHFLLRISNITKKSLQLIHSCLDFLASIRLIFG